MDFIIKSNDMPTNYGRYPGARPVDELLKSGFILLDKWPGPTSRDVASTVKKILGAGKTGHCGTLDPSVSGVLPLCLDSATKVMPALQGLDKEYVGVMRLHKDVSKNELLAATKKFIGKIKQMPPVRSAVARHERERYVYSFDIIEIDGRDVLFRMSCQAGTYVRVVCHQIGKLIGGANMTELRRTSVGRFTEENLVRMEDLADAYVAWKENKKEDIRNYILPVEAAVEHLPKIIIKDSSVFSIASGSPLYSVGISKVSKDIAPGELVAILTLKGELVALSKAAMTSEEMTKRRGIAAKTDSVVMDRKIYPKM
ncbi:MAG: RNA-guided pseudouridylation complex pseudouridine synthase subunit Cbf5 [Candidatus Aenigmatarchaeota archaeon]